MTNAKTALGVILAGGRSRRFAADEGAAYYDKFLAPLGDTTLLGHIIARASTQVAPLILNINGDTTRVADYGLEVFTDEVPDQGPLSGLLAAMALADQRGFDQILTFSGDSPFFPDDYGARLTEAALDTSSPIVIAQSGGRPHPVMGLFPVSLRPALAAYLQSGERRMMAWIEQHPHKLVVWDDNNPNPFFNINRRQDLKVAERYLASSRSQG